MQYLQTLRKDPAAAHTGPLVAFLLLSIFPSWIRGEGQDDPWYLSQPEHWWYPLQTFVCFGLLWWWRGHYQFPPVKPRYLIVAVILACAGISLWVLPGILHQRWSSPDAPWPGWWRFLGLVDRSEGFDPTLLEDHPYGRKLSIALRMVRSVLLVPLLEEICWRGWLMRMVIAGDKPFTSVPFGTHSRNAFWITTLAVTLVHRPEDWIAAFIWGSLMYLLAVKSKSLRACVFMHAVGNLLLAIYILRTGQFGYW